MSKSLRAAEAFVEGFEADRALPVRARERRSALGAQEFIVTAYGTPTAFEEHADEIETWFDTVRFLPIAEK